jgi:hypothetical protein
MALNKAQIVDLLQAHTSDGNAFTLQSNSQSYDCFWWDGTAWNRDAGDKLEGGQESKITEDDVFALLSSFLNAQDEADLLEKFSATSWAQFYSAYRHHN